VISFVSFQDLYADEVRVGQKAPLFSLKDLQGQTYSLEKFIGKKVIHLTFLATWCDPCRKDYEKLNDDYAWFGSKGYILLGIGVPARQSQKKIEEFAAS
jgi:peroxiredoxin